MTKNSLTDELRSVLLSHALDAPEPDDTVDRVLASTVGTAATAATAGTAATAATAGIAAPGRPGRRRPPGQLLVAASAIVVLLLAVAGINSTRHHNPNRTASAPGTSQPAGSATGSAGTPGNRGPQLAPRVPSGTDTAGGTVPKPANPPTYVGSSLNCSTIPGGHLVTGAWAGFRLSASGQLRYAYEFRCVGTNGQRSASEVQILQPVGNQLRYQQTLVRPASQEHVDFITGGTDSVQIQASAPSTITGKVPDAVLITTYVLDAQGGGEGDGTVIAQPCLAAGLTATLTLADPLANADAAPHWLLALVNKTASRCALEGYPTVQPRRAGRAVGSAAGHTLSGPAGGVTRSPVPPIIVLNPAATAAAIIERSPAGTTCGQSDQVTLTLPNGVSLGSIKADLPACDLVVHPLVNSPLGSQ